MSIKVGEELGSKLVKLLGLPEYTVSFTLRCAVNEIVTVTCEYYPEGHLEDAGQEDYETVFAEYRLERIESEL